MTAIVGIINSRGIAFAADSAATHTTSSTTKISNTANKIFALSKKHPVGIALYNNLDFYGIPWEVIIKRYRDSYLKNKSFPKLVDYINDFWQYLSKELLKKVADDDQLRLVDFITGCFKNETIEYAKNELLATKMPIDMPHMFPEIIKFLRRISAHYALYSKTSDFKDYTKENFEKYAKNIIDEKIEDLLKDPNCPTEFRDAFIDALYLIIISDINVYTSYTGLVFWGFGEEELLPAYYQYIVPFAFDNKIKYYKENEYIVSYQHNACVAPFAQTDVVNTVVRGIDNDLRNEVKNIIDVSFEDLKNNIADILDKNGAPCKLVAAVKGIDIDSHVSIIKNKIDDYIQSNYIDKLLTTVAYLSKDDLADMAESLVRMTCLKRHVTTDAESVGGPVDVAVISKGYGFVWIKRKHYFDANLNYDYFQRIK